MENKTLVAYFQQAASRQKQPNPLLRPVAGICMKSSPQSPIQVRT